MSTPEGARQSEKFVAVCLDPDYCWTPSGSGKRVVPYIVACDLSQSESCSPDVFFTDEPVFLYKSSYAPKVKGNEAACPDGGKLSQTRNGIVWVEEHEATVLVNDIPVVRDGDMCWMNGKQ